MSVAEILSELRRYTALDNESRLQAYLTLCERPSIAFNELARRVHVQKGLLAYHLGVLKAAGLVEVKYQRASKKTSEYYPTKEGKKLLRKLCPKATKN